MYKLDATLAYLKNMTLLCISLDFKTKVVWRIRELLYLRNPLWSSRIPQPAGPDSAAIGTPPPFASRKCRLLRTTCHLYHISSMINHTLHSPVASCYIYAYFCNSCILILWKPCSLAFLGVLQIVHPWSLQDVCCILEAPTCSAKLESIPATAACHPGWNRRMSLSKSFFNRWNQERCPIKKGTLGNQP